MTDSNPENLSHLEKALVLPRRWVLSTMGVSALLAGSSLSGTVYAAQPASREIQQPETSSDAAFIQRAFEMRRLALEYGDQAYGAVVVRLGEIIGESWSRVILDHDPTGHAEISAIRDAARRAKDRDVSGAILYSSSRPCSMCEAAASWCGIGEMIYGKDATRAGRPRQCR